MGPNQAAAADAANRAAEPAALALMTLTRRQKVVLATFGFLAPFWWTWSVHQLLVGSSSVVTNTFASPGDLTFFAGSLLIPLYAFWNVRRANPALQGTRDDAARG